MFLVDIDRGLEKNHQDRAVDHAEEAEERVAAQRADHHGRKTHGRVFCEQIGTYQVVHIGDDEQIARQDDDRRRFDNLQGEIGDKVFVRRYAFYDQNIGVVLGRAEAFASKNTVTASFLDGLFMGIGFTAVLVTLGAMREAIGFGTLFQQAHLMFGEAAREMTVTLFDDYRGYLLAILPPGAFIGLGLLIAGKNILDKKRAVREKLITAEPAEALS